MDALAVFNIEGFLHYSVRPIPCLQVSISMMRIIDCDKDETVCGGTFTNARQTNTFIPRSSALSRPVPTGAGVPGFAFSLPLPRRMHAY